jgi:hypothetical protein
VPETRCGSFAEQHRCKQRTARCKRSDHRAADYFARRVRQHDPPQSRYARISFTIRPPWLSVSEASVPFRLKKGRMPALWQAGKFIPGAALR